MPLSRLLARTAVKDWRHVTAVFTGAVLLESMAMGHLNAFTPIYLHDQIGVSPADIGVWTGFLTTATYFVAFPLAPFWGALAERYSRKLLIIRSQYIEVFAYGLCAFAPDLTWVIIARALLGLTYGNVAIVIASQSLLTPERKVGSAIAIVQAANPIAASLGPPIGALLIPMIGTRGLFLFDASACLLAAAITTILMPEPPGRDQTTSVLANMRHSLSSVMRRPELRFNFLAWFLVRGGSAVVDTYLPVRITELVSEGAAAAIGMIVGVYGVLTTVATWAAGKVVDRFGAGRSFWPVMVVGVASTVGILVVPWLPFVAVAAWLRCLPVGIGNVALYAHLTDVLDRSERAPIMTLTPIPRNLAQFVVSAVAAGASVAGTAPALVVAVLAYGAAVWVGYRLERATRPILALKQLRSRADQPVDSGTR